MKLNKIIVIILISIFLLGISSMVVNAETRKLTPVEIHGKLKLDGTNIVDKNGNKFQIRGISTHGIAWFPQYINQEAFIDLRDNWKINTIRLALYSDPGAGYTRDLRSKVKEGVEYARNAGLYVIIDWHTLNDNVNANKTEAIDFFREMANLYKDYDNVIYEVCNEQTNNVSWNNEIKPYAEELIKEIRNIDKEHLIIVGCSTWCQDVDIVSQNPIEGENILYSCHFYAATHKDNIRSKLQTALNNNLPVIISEFGISEASGNGNVDREEANRWMSIIDENNLGYICWNLSNKNETSSLLSSSTNKVSGWTYDELSEEGKWLQDKLKSYPEEKVEQKEEPKQETQEVQESDIIVEEVKEDTNLKNIVLIIIASLAIVIAVIATIVLTIKITKKR